ERLPHLGVLPRPEDVFLPPALLGGKRVDREAGPQRPLPLFERGHRVALCLMLVPAFSRRFHGYAGVKESKVKVYATEATVAVKLQGFPCAAARASLLLRSPRHRWGEPLVRPAWPRRPSRAARLRLAAHPSPGRSSSSSRLLRPSEGWPRHSFCRVMLGQPPSRASRAFSSTNSAQRSGTSASRWMASVGHSGTQAP